MVLGTSDSPGRWGRLCGWVRPPSALARASHFCFSNGSFFAICPTCLSRWVLGCSPESLSSRCCLQTSCSPFKAQGKCHLTCDAFPCGSRLLPVPPVLPQNSVRTAIRVVIAPSCNCVSCVCSSRSKMGVAHLYPLCVTLCSESVCMVSGTGGGSVNASEGAAGWLIAQAGASPPAPSGHNL